MNVLVKISVVLFAIVLDDSASPVSTFNIIAKLDTGPGNLTVTKDSRVEAGDSLTEFLRSGARELIQQAVDTELKALLAAHTERKTEDGRTGVVRNGYLAERSLVR